MQPIFSQSTVTPSKEAFSQFIADSRIDPLPVFSRPMSTEGDRSHLVPTSDVTPKTQKTVAAPAETMGAQPHLVPSTPVTPSDAESASAESAIPQEGILTAAMRWIKAKSDALEALGGVSGPGPVKAQAQSLQEKDAVLHAMNVEHTVLAGAKMMGEIDGVIKKLDTAPVESPELQQFLKSIAGLPLGVHYKVQELSDELHRSGGATPAKLDVDVMPVHFRMLTGTQGM